MWPLLAIESYQVVMWCSVPRTLDLQQSADPEGGTGSPDPPPGKSQVIWVSIGNKQLDPPWKKLDPPLENIGPPLEP